MKTECRICDICASDDEAVIADGTYTTNEGNTFDGCEEHLEQCRGYGFSITKFEAFGDVKMP